MTGVPPKLFERFGAMQQLPELQLSSRELAWGLYENLTRVTLELYAKTPSDDLLIRLSHTTKKAEHVHF